MIFKKLFSTPKQTTNIYKGFDLNATHDQWGMIAAARYEKEHAKDPDDKILKRAKELREIWQTQGLFHTDTITSVWWALRNM